MKRFGRAIGLTAAAALTVTLFAGCAGTTEPATTEAGTTETTPSEQTSTLSGTISTNGSTSMESVISALKEVFEASNPGVTITYDATGSSAGITAATDGTADIGLSSRELKDTETGLTASVVALDGIAMIVNTANPVEDLTVEQIAGLFKGEITNWSEVGGSDMPVTLIGREAGSGTRDGFESIVGVAEECKYDQEMTSTGAVISSVSTNEYAIGYASLSSVGDTVKSVTVGGIPCTEETVLDGTYAIQRPFVIVTNASAPLSEAAQAFIDFALSPEAKEVIEAAGAVQP
ncbi:MAG: phosphate ABC transporter substrate-binding protein [Oscillospiraceae bacterium]|nr:phosphate ABC transporter substrate-binding protein [Oscillospiraceae bacterium]